MKNLKALFVPSAIVSAMVISGNAMAADAVDYSAITGAIDFGTVIQTVMAVAAAYATVHLAIAGVKMVMSRVKNS